jgi:DNA-binding transcriptional LysR family regulator
MTTTKALYAWELKKGKRETQVRVAGQVTVNTQPQMIQAALDGFGLTFVPEDAVIQHMRNGHLLSVLRDWCPVWPGYRAYYPSRRQTSRAFSLVIDALKHQS